MADEMSPFKILAHTDRIELLKNNGWTDPILAEIDPTPFCNHNCIWCLDKDQVKRTEKGVKSFSEEDLMNLLSFLCDKYHVKAVVFKGGGEPLMLKCMPSIMRQAKMKFGLEVALTTNGELLNGEAAEAVAKYCSWVRVSVDAVFPETHAIIHRPRDPESFHKVVNNIWDLVKLRGRLKSNVKIGYKVSLDWNNYKEIERMVDVACGMGCDSISLRPVDLDCHGFDGKMTKEVVDGINTGLALVKDEGYKGFRVMVSGFRKPRVIRGCWIPHFILTIASDGTVYNCCDLKGRSRFSQGSIFLNGDIRGLARGKAAKRRSERLECRGFCSLKYDFTNEILGYILDKDKVHENFI